MAKYIVKTFLLLQFILILSWAIGNEYILLNTDFSLGKNLNDVSNSIFWSRANFDGFYYTKIARDGYQYLEQSFFPFYPFLISSLSNIFQSYILSGLFISNLAFFGMIYALFLLLRQEGFDFKQIKNIILVLILFPTSFYFLSVYSESLLLFFVFLSLYFMKKRNYLLAGLLAGLASYTKLSGIFLFPALLIEYYEQASKRSIRDRLYSFKSNILNDKGGYLIHLIKSRSFHIKNLLLISLSGWGLVKYMWYLKRSMGDWFYFYNIKPGFLIPKDTEKITLIYQVFFRYLKMIITVRPNHWVYVNIWLEVIIAFVFLLLLLEGLRRYKYYNIRLSWLFFTACAYFLPTLSGTFSSLPRYVLLCFPCFIVISKLLKTDKIKYIYFAISSIFLIILSAFFFKGYWIS